MELVVIKDRVIGSFGLNTDENDNPNEFYGIYGYGKQSLMTLEHYQELQKVLEHALDCVKTNIALSK